MGKTASLANIGTIADSSLGFRNRVINGGMTVDQRNAGALINPAVSGYIVDRWGYYQAQASKGTIGQNAGSVTPPTGYSKYLGFTSTSAYSVLTTDQFVIYQKIEGFNTADLAWGTASAATVTLSFWVRSSLTGTFGGTLQNSAQDRAYPFTYTISSANTWEQKTVTVAGDTTGTWVGATNGTGLQITFGLGSGATYSATAGAWTAGSYSNATGATSVVGTNGATFYITGVQLEKGSTATSFDYRPYGTELALCQRYYEKSFNQSTAPAQNIGATGAFRFVQAVTTNTRQICSGTAFFRVTKRATPTITLFNPEAANALPRNQQRALDWVDAGGLGKATPSDSVIQFTDWTTCAAGGAGDDFTVQWTASSEL